MRASKSGILSIPGFCAGKQVAIFAVRPAFLMVRHPVLSAIICHLSGSRTRGSDTSWRQCRYPLKDGATMRVAAIIALVLVSTTPSEASKSCMTKTEARQHFGSVHIYWHGPDRCWDATPSRRYANRKVQRKILTPEVKRTTDKPKWRNSISQLLADGDPLPSIGTSADARRYENDGAVAATRWIDRWTDIEPSLLAARWVDIAPVERPAIVEAKAERSVRPHGMVLVFIAFVILTLGTIEVLFGGRFYQWPRPGRMT